jgi:hypothetical protein
LLEEIMLERFPGAYSFLWVYFQKLHDQIEESSAELKLNE